MERTNNLGEDLNENIAFEYFAHKFCMRGSSHLRGCTTITAHDFMQIWDAIDDTDGLFSNGNHTLCEVVGEENWQKWSDSKRLNAKYVVAELIRRRLVPLAVSSAPFTETRYEFNLTGISTC